MIGIDVVEHESCGRSGCGRRVVVGAGIEAFCRAILPGAAADAQDDEDFAAAAEMLDGLFT